MHCLKRVMLAGLFVVPFLFVQSAWAGLDFLPESSHYQGRAYKGMSGDRVRVDFAVYDRFGGNEFAAPGDKQYTYVYQIFNEVEDDTFSIDIFRIFEIDPVAISGFDQISSEDDANGGIATDLEYFNPSKTNGVWEFDEGTLIQGEHSWFLTISSDYDFVAGDFSINSSDDEITIPATPEPATMMLLGVGSFILLARRKGSVWMLR